MLNVISKLRAALGFGGGTLRARYDAAQTTTGNSRHWSMADALSADAAMNPGVRRTLYMRGQYEYDNNSYCQGIIETIANDDVGPGPQLQLRLPVKTSDRLALQRSKNIERAFAQWAWATDLAGKMRLMRIGRAVRGEMLAKEFNNGGLRSPIQLDFEVIEGSQVVGQEMIPTDNYYDGIHYDPFGNPLRYEIARTPPGSVVYSPLPDQVDTVDASRVFHYFKRLRAGQRRGIPEITPALPLFAYSRRLTLATVEAAETAANHAGVVESELGADPEQAEALATGDLVDLERNGGVVLPPGYKLKQLEAEHPTSTYADFIYCLIREIARCLNVPVSIALMDSSRGNMSQAYLDRQAYIKARAIERFELEGFLDWVLEKWIAEARYTFPELYGVTLADLTYSWRWPSMGDHADPNKVASAQATRMSIGRTHPARELTEAGLDWEAEQELAAESLGYADVDEYRRDLRLKIFRNGNPDPAEQPAEPAPAPTE